MSDAQRSQVPMLPRRLARQAVQVPRHVWSALRKFGWLNVGIIFAALLLILFSVLTAMPTQAAFPKLDKIRVAIFIKLNNYTLTTPAATFSSTSPVVVSLRNTDAYRYLFTTSGTAHSVRIRMNDFKVKVLETTDPDKATSVAARIRKLGGTPFVTLAAKSQTVLYEITEGSYSSSTEATTAASKWASDLELSSLTKVSAYSIRGNKHWQSGTFTTEQAALDRARLIGSKGVETYVAYKQVGTSNASYTVLVGAAVDQATLDSIKIKASTVTPDVKALESDAKYVISQKEFTATTITASSPPSPLLQIPLLGTKIAIQTSASATLKLSERYGRKYRGMFEVSGLNSKLAVVNELPFEQYLYSVVGSEIPSSWHPEALKAQAVTARTYAINSGHRFTIAHVNDTTLSQVYSGISQEDAKVIAAVDSTRGEIAHIDGKAISALFTSNSGGKTADSVEIWGGSKAYLKPVLSYDYNAENGLKSWYRVVLDNGRNGYVREDFLATTTVKSNVGLATMTATAAANVRRMPLVDESIPVIETLAAGERVTILGIVKQSNPYSWIRGPYSAIELRETLAKRASNTPTVIKTIEVGKKGPSGRATELKANGIVLTISYPDLFRSALGGLPSTLFTIEQTAQLSVLGANGQVTHRPNSVNTLGIMGSSGRAVSVENNDVYVMNKNGKVRAATRDPGFIIQGNGFGHGVGLSQYGAQALATQGKTYTEIIRHFFTGVTVSKE